MAPSQLRFRLPFPLSMVSRAGDSLRHRLVRIDTDRFKRAAQRITKLDDFGDEHGFQDRLQRVSETLQQVDFNLIGRLAVLTMMRWHLINRLNVVDLLKHRPELRDIDVSAPIVIVGLFRTGTTFLHNVMAADPAARVGQMWEFSYPVGRVRDPLGDTRWRKRRTSIPLMMNHAAVPDQDVVHYVTSDGYEEDFFLLGSDMALMTAIVGMGNWQHAWDLLDQDLEVPYQWHRLQLQILSAQRSADRWLLKCPWHLWNLESLLKVYPKAKVIHIHRDIPTAIGSQCSLAARIVCRLHRNTDVKDVANFWVDYSFAGLERGQKAKDQLPPSQLFDVRLKDLRAAPLETLRQIYQQFDLPFDEGLSARFERAVAERPTFQHGVHDYCLEDFGLEEHAVRERFAAYCARFGV